MSSCQIFEYLEKIAETPGSNDKIELLSKGYPLFDGMFKEVIRLGLCPMTTFGYKPSMPDSTGINSFSDETFQLLDKLAARQLTGHAARDAVQTHLATLTKASQELLIRVLLKDFRAGFSEALVNKAQPGWVITFKCMLAHKFSEYKKKVTYPLLGQPKFDGVRVLAFVDAPKGLVSFFSRSGKEFTAFEALKPAFLKLASLKNGRFVFDGEVVSGSFNETVGAVRKKEEQATDAVFYVFDLVPLSFFESAEKVYKKPLEARHQELVELLEEFKALPDNTEVSKVASLPTETIVSEEDVDRAYLYWLGLGLEGFMGKDPKGFYERKRSKSWLKIKAEESVDVRVVGAYKGDSGKKFENSLGGLVVDFDGVMVNVGGGFSELRDGKSRDEFMEAVAEDLSQLGLSWDDAQDGEIILDALQLAKLENPRVLSRLIEVQYHEVTPDGSLRHPRYKRFRDDKDGL